MVSTAPARPQAVVYDDRDMHYMAGLELPQLRQERWRAKLELQTAEFWYLEEEAGTWRAYLELVERTIKHLQANQVKPRWTPKGHIDIASIKASADILEVAERYTTMKKAGSRFTGCCPLHNEKLPSFFVFPEDQTWHCFGCNKGGDAISLVMAAGHMDFKSACAALQK